MLARVSFFFLLVCSLVAKDERVAHFDGSPAGIAAGWVNVISGSIVHGETDLVIPGIEPLHISRSPLYAPGYAYKDKVKESWNFPFMEKLERQINKTNYKEDLVIFHGAQELLSFKGGSLEEPELRRFQSSDHPKGYTNQGGARATGRTALKNYAINRGSPHWMVLYSGSGEVRDYRGDPQQSVSKNICLPLREIVRPNGFRHAFQYDNNQKKQGVTVRTPTGRPVAYYGFDDAGDSLLVQSYDGRSVEYQFQRVGEKNGSSSRYLKEVQRTDGPSVKYQYATEGSANGQLKKIEYPSERGACFDYWDGGDYVKEKGKTVKLADADYNRSRYKVHKLFQPVGADAKMVQTHTFDYYSKGDSKGGWTDVIDFEKNKDVYLFDADYRLREVRYYKGMAEKYFVEKFFWDKEGQLTLSALCDGDDNPLRAKLYRYMDGRGNTTEERVFGNLTGDGKAIPRLDGNGNFNFSELESFGTYFDHSIDGKNLLVKEKHENGLTILYSYREGTDLVAEKTTLAHDISVKKESFIYDDDHRLIQSIEDDGERKKIARFIPMERPFGYPQEKKIFGWSQETGEVFLESYHYTYNIMGDITSEEKRDTRGKTVYKVVRGYNSHGHCTYEINEVGDHIQRQFDLNGNCTFEEGPRAGLVKEFKYDWMNRCTQESITYKGKTSKKDYVYNERGHRTATTDQFNQTTLFTVDRFGNETQIETPPIFVDGAAQKPVIQQRFDHFGNVIAITDPLSRTTKRRYTSRNKPYLVEHPNGTTEQFRYTPDGHLCLSIDQEGVETRYHWDPLGRLTSKVTPFGAEYYHYKGLLLSSSIDLAGIETSYKYDPFGRLSETVCGERKEALSYDSYGYPCRKSYYEGDRLLKTEVTQYDALKRVVASYVEDPSGLIFCHKRFEYDGAGNCLVEWDGEAKTTKKYDGENRVIEVVDPLGNIHRVEYLKGSVLKKTVTDPLGQKVVTLYNTQGKEVKISHIDRSGIELLSRELFYDLAGHLVKEEKRADGKVQTLLYQIDSMGRVIALIEPLEKVTRTSYTSTGRLEVLTKPDGVQLVHTYDRGRLASLKSSDGQLVYSYSYSPRGELLEVIDEVSGFSSRQAFSIYGDLVEEVLPTGQTLTYQHDGIGRITSYPLPDGGEVIIDYNAITATSITRCDQKKKHLYTHAYTKFNIRGDVTEQQLIGNGGSVSFTFDEMYQLKGATHSKWKEEELTYDKIGNLLSYNLNGENHHFSYDSLYQLIEENNHSYTFDPFHNRRSKDGDWYQLNDLNELKATGANQYSYDPNGNLTRVENEKETLLFGYDPLNRLIFVQKGELQVHLKYDPFNRRISRDGQPFYFFREQEIGDEHSLRILGLGLGADIGATVAIELKGQVYAPLHDHNGSITALIDLDGNLVEEWSYTAFGEQIGTTPSPWTYSSKRHDPLTLWLSFGRRDYDPETGRWTTPDPLGFAAGPNLYAYVSNRPLTHRDPLGLFDSFDFARTSVSLLTPGGIAANAVSSGFRYFSPDTAEWAYRPNKADFGYKYNDNPYVFDANPRGYDPQPGVKQITVNGMFMSNSAIGYFGDFLSELSGTPHQCIANVSTGSFFSDLFRAASGLILKEYSKATVLTHQKIKEAFDEPSTEKVLLTLYSEGGIVGRGALVMIEPKLREKVDVLGIGLGCMIEPELCGSILHICSSSDPVARTDLKNYILNYIFDNYFNVCTFQRKPSAFLFDHNFRSDTIADPIRKSYEYHRQHGTFNGATAYVK